MRQLQYNSFQRRLVLFALFFSCSRYQNPHIVTNVTHQIWLLSSIFLLILCVSRFVPTAMPGKREVFWSILQVAQMCFGSSYVYVMTCADSRHFSIAQDVFFFKVSEFLFFSLFVLSQ